MCCGHHQGKLCCCCSSGRTKDGLPVRPIETPSLPLLLIAPENLCWVYVSNRCYSRFFSFDPPRSLHASHASCGSSFHARRHRDGGLRLGRGQHHRHAREPLPLVRCHRSQDIGVRPPRQEASGHVRVRKLFLRGVSSAPRGWVRERRRRFDSGTALTSPHLNFISQFS